MGVVGVTNVLCTVDSFLCLLQCIPPVLIGDDTVSNGGEEGLGKATCNYGTGRGTKVAL